MYGDYRYGAGNAPPPARVGAYQYVNPPAVGYVAPKPLVLSENPSLIIRDMRMKDVDKVYELQQKAFTRAWLKESIKEEIENDLARYIIIKADKQLVAYGGMWLILNEAHVTNIAVHPDARKRGFGTRVMKELMKVALNEGIHEMFLEVRVDNAGAIKLYESLGFETITRHKEYYDGYNGDSFMMYCQDTRCNLVEEQGKE